MYSRRDWWFVLAPLMNSTWPWVICYGCNLNIKLWQLQLHVALYNVLLRRSVWSVLYVYCAVRGLIIWLIIYYAKQSHSKDSLSQNQYTVCTLSRPNHKHKAYRLVQICEIRSLEMREAPYYQRIIYYFILT